MLNQTLSYFYNSLGFNNNLGYGDLFRSCNNMDIAIIFIVFVGVYLYSRMLNAYFMFMDDIEDYSPFSQYYFYFFFEI